MRTKGFVYILTNPSFKEDYIKIGQTTNLEKRIKSLSSTSSVPTPFEKYATLETVKYKEVEHLMHKMIDGVTNLRINKKREFFEIKPSVALDMFHCIKPVLEDDAEIKIFFERKEDLEHKKTITAKRSNFTFSSVNIEIGETITFFPANIDVTVYSDNRVKYQGEIYSLSGFTKKFMPENKKVRSGSYQGPKFFSYKGSVLTVMKKEIQ